MHSQAPRRPAAAILLILAQAACAGVAVPTPTGPVAADVVAGFDTRSYPGDGAMAAWLETSPYRWVGYYLAAPCYTGTTWLGRRASLHAAGWGTAVLFVGEQDWSAMAAAGDTTAVEPGARCTAQNLTAAQGRLDATTADSAMAAEGFAPGTPVFLDVERMERVSSSMEAYVRAWFDGMLELGRYPPALYAHERNVTTLYETGRGAFAAAGRSDTPILWVARSGDFDVARRPADSGILTASIWQGVFDEQQTWGGVTLTVDGNVALTAIPGIVFDARR